jgi:hypothetical protein
MAMILRWFLEVSTHLDAVLSVVAIAGVIAVPLIVLT